MVDLFLRRSPTAGLQKIDNFLIYSRWSAAADRDYNCYLLLLAIVNRQFKIVNKTN
jgi:hypothetical protein